MSCHKIKSQLYDYRDGELDPLQSEEIDKHLQSCEDCKAELSRIQASIRMVQHVETVEPPPYLSTRIMARVREESQKQPWFSKVFFKPITIPSGAFAALLILLASFHVYMQGPIDSKVSTSSQHTAIQQRGNDKADIDTFKTERHGIEADIALSGSSEEKKPQEHLVQEETLSKNSLLTVEVESGSQVKNIDENSKMLLRNLVNMDVHIQGIVSDENTYQITAEVDFGTQKRVINYLELNFHNVTLLGVSKAQENTLPTIQEQPDASQQAKDSKSDINSFKGEMGSIDGIVAMPGSPQIQNPQETLAKEDKEETGLRIILRK